MSSQGGNAARLAALTRTLNERWHQTRELWQDDKAREFEERFIQTLDASVRTAVLGIEHLETILRQVRRDCE